MSSLMSILSSSVNWKNSLEPKIFCRCLVNVHGTRCPRCTGPEGPLPGYRTNLPPPS
jgi:hypothetical protein